MKKCLHENFEASVNVGRLSSTEGGPVTSYTADIRIKCAQCGEPFEFIGAPLGYSPNQPMVSVDCQELRAPLRPSGEFVEQGAPMPGFRIHVKDHSV